MSARTSHTLEVPGARLYYEIQGSGPVLMLIGHPMGISGFAAIVPLLAEDYTVVTYDPRGFARSTIDDRDQDGEPDLLADDVRRVLEAIGSGPAHVFGSSGGAVTGLALVTRSPTTWAPSSPTSPRSPFSSPKPMRPAPAFTRSTTPTATPAPELRGRGSSPSPV